MARLAVSALLAAALLAGCATRGPIAFSCASADDPDPERRTFHPLPTSPLVQDIQSEVRDTSVGARPRQPAATTRRAPHQSDPIDRAFDRAVASLAGFAIAPPVETLLLSGGGQWGAFGAGFFGTLGASGRWPDPMVVTGVSTGGLQALMVTAEAPALATNLAALAVRYQPDRESEIARRGPMWQAALTGAVADIAPLRRRIEATLCTDGKPERGCPVIASLAAAHAGGRSALIGMVAADSGDFIVADATRIAAAADPTDPVSLGETQQCLTAAVMASLAMPAFFRQVTINGRSYFDGGVRHSLLEGAVAASAWRAAPSGAIRLNVVRNGPTVADRIEDAAHVGINDRQDALDLGLRAYALMVNQLELNSIAALRLEHPSAPFRLVTADGWNKATPGRPACVKRKGPMFDPVFMRCLMVLGQEKGRRDEPWIIIRPLAEAKP